MDQTCYFMLAICIVLLGYGAGDIQCKHRCQSDLTCNYRKIEDTCYYVFKDKRRNWFQSRQFCVDQGLSMVKLTQGMTEQNQTYDFSGLFNGIPGIPGSYWEAWLAGRAVDLSDWTFLNYIKAESIEERHNGDFASCGFINMNNNKLQMDVGRCFNRYPFFCRFNQTNIQHYDTNKTWFEARSHCIQLGGDLFYLYQNETLYSFQNQGLKNITGPHHIGLRHRVWEWTDGSEIIFTNWSTDVPNGLDKKCLHLYGHSGKWSITDCLEDVLTFCQRGQSNQVQMQLSQLKVSVIILGSLLGVFLITTISLVIYNVCTKWSCKSANEDIEIIENNYYSSEPKNGLVTTKNNRVTSPVDSTSVYSHGANSGTEFTSNKPMTKPKPIIGPKTGDVYSTVDKSKCTPIRPDDTQLYVNNV